MSKRQKYHRTFSLRWHGRRWYDPNEKKVVLTTVPVGLLAGLARMLIFGLASTHPTPMKAMAPPAVGIVGTAHDLSSTGLNHVTSSSEVCVFCHIPHGSASGVNQQIPEWNHATTVTQFVMYTSASMKGTIDSQPVGPSLACLSCHDGTLAMGALHELPTGGGQGDYSHAQGGVSTATGRMVGGNMVGGDLSIGHPISMAYRDDLNPSLKPAGDLVGVRLYPSNIRGAKVQCASCHDPHNYGAQGSTAPFLRVTKERSALCLACHKV